jgi:hypothetical protein
VFVLATGRATQQKAYYSGGQQSRSRMPLYELQRAVQNVSDGRVACPSRLVGGRLAGLIVSLLGFSQRGARLIDGSRRR